MIQLGVRPIEGEILPSRPPVLSGNYWTREAEKHTFYPRGRLAFARPRAVCVLVETPVFIHVPSNVSHLVRVHCELCKASLKCFGVVWIYLNLFNFR